MSLNFQFQMSSFKEFYKSAHPDYFSDSKVEEVRELDRALLEFHLNTLTSRSQEADFEQFARRLCEKEICPNLLPTTGPTGGGDSKADSETFPVADDLVLKWYSGEAREASKERWAFAFSAKAAWRPKVQSDVKKIVETERDYKKVLFVTNQNVPARKRAEVEDALAKKYKVDVRILDRTWILERVFAGRHEEIAISELKVTALKSQVEGIGPLDSERIAALETLEKRIASAVESKQFGPSLVDDAIDAAELCRMIEKPRTEIEGSYARAIRLATKCGTPRQSVEAPYQWAWTLIWWFEDLDSAVPQYELVEDRARGSENVYDIERLCNLLTILTSYSVNEGDAQLRAWIIERTHVVRNELVRLVEDEDRPSVSLYARTLLLQNRLLEHLSSNDDPSKIFDELKDVVEKAEGLVGYPLDPLVRSMTIIGSKIGNNASYDALFDAIVNASSQRDGEVRAARLLLTRGEHFMRQEKPTRAIAIVGQALSRLHKHETRREIVHALYLCAHAYERLGLLWAARGTYLSGTNIAANDFWFYGDITRGFRECVSGLKRIELMLGRLPHVLAWHELDMLIRNRNLEGEVSSDEQERDSEFDLLLARLIVRMPQERHAEMGSLADTLDRLGLFISESSLLFLLGHFEKIEKIAPSAESSSEVFINNIWNLEADIPLPEKPELYNEDKIFLKTKILGCTIKVECQNIAPCLEIAESFLASLESVLSTSGVHGAFAYEPEMTVQVIIGNPQTTFISIKEEERAGKFHMVMECQPLDPYQLSNENRANVRDEVFKAALVALAHVAMFRDYKRDIEGLFKLERVSDRAAAFTGTVGTLHNVLGNSPKFQIAQWLNPNAIGYSMKRSELWQPSQRDQKSDADQGKPPFTPGEGEPPIGLFDREKMSHGEMDMVSPIRQRLWERARWCGVLYMSDETSVTAPVMGLMFENREAGLEIFSNWFSELGRVDEKKSLGLAIVRGIDEQNPHAYRMLIRGNLDAEAEAGKLLTFMQRIHRMDATTSANLDRFLKEYGIHKRFVLVSAFMENNRPIPNFDYAIGILEITVRNAWEIGINDLDGAGVLDDDAVIIPKGVADPPVKKLLEWKKSFGETVN